MTHLKKKKCTEPYRQLETSNESLFNKTNQTH